jgi:hypothetical protein
MKIIYASSIFAMIMLSLLTVQGSAAQDGPPADFAAPPPHPAAWQQGEGRMDRGHRAVEIFMDRLRAESPDEHRRLERLRRDDQSAFRDELRERLMSRRREIFEARRPQGIEGRRQAGAELDRPEEQVLDAISREIGRLLREYRQAPEAERPQLERSIRKELERSFDIRQNRQSEMIHNLEIKLAEMKRIFQEKSERRETIIDRQLRDLLSPRGPERRKPRMVDPET